MYRALHITRPLFVILFLAHDWWSQTLDPRQMGGGGICGERQHGGFYITPPLFCRQKSSFHIFWVKGLLSPPHITTPVGEKLPLVLRI